MDLDQIRPIILAGGTGKRLQPLSTQEKPKQFHRLYSNHTLFQETVNRISKMKMPVIVSNKAYSNFITEDLRDINKQADRTILEPISRNTAPAITSATLILDSLYQDPVILVLPSDHIIEDSALFYNAIKDAASIVKKGYIAAFGIKPTNPNTNYGYMQIGEELSRTLIKSKFFRKNQI